MKLLRWLCSRYFATPCLFRSASLLLGNTNNIRKLPVSKMFAAAGTYGIVNIRTNNQLDKALPDLEQTYDDMLLKISLESEHKLTELMYLLISCVVEKSKEYRALLKKEYDLRGKELNVEEEEELKQYQLRAQVLRNELKKYKEIISNAGDMAYHQAISSYLTGSENAKELVCREYCSLEKMAENQFKMNRSMEYNLESD